MKKQKKLKSFKIKHLKKIYIIMILVAVVLSTIVFFECFNSPDKRSAFSEEKLIDFNKGWVDSNNKSVKLNPFLSNKGFKPGKTYTYYHDLDKNIKEGDSICFRALSTDVTLYIGDKKKIETPYHKGMFTLSSSGTVWYFYTLKKEYFRDKEAGIAIDVPKDYFPDNDDTKEPRNTWRSGANLLYSNWLNYFVYQSTPYLIDKIESC